MIDLRFEGWTPFVRFTPIQTPFHSIKVEKS